MNQNPSEIKLEPHSSQPELRVPDHLVQIDYSKHHIEEIILEHMDQKELFIWFWKLIKNHCEGQIFNRLIKIL